MTPATREDDDRNVREAIHLIGQKWWENNPIDMDEVANWLEGAIRKTMENWRTVTATSLT